MHIEIRSALDGTEFYGFQLDDNPHDMALLPAGPLSRAIGTSASGGLRAEDAALHACGMPTWLLLQVGSCPSGFSRLPASLRLLSVCLLT